MCGVYYLLDDNLAVIYVGASKNVKQRLSAHRSNIRFDLYCYDECEESELRERECAAIRKFRPKLNEANAFFP